jgi:enterochelin esterase-like enzyme
VSISRRSTLAGLAAAAAPGLLGAAPSFGRVVDLDPIASRFAPARRVSVWLPPDYETDRARRRVLYMHDGQNLFEPGPPGSAVEWGVDEAIARLPASQRAPIVVGVWNTPTRRQDYMPTKVAARLSEALQARLTTDRFLPSFADGYVRYLVEELKPAIDARFRTRPGRGATMIAGSSMGGLISLYALCERPEVFGAAGCLSTHWPSIGSGFQTGDLGTPEMIAAYQAYFDVALPRANSARLWFDHGDKALDSAYGPYQAAMDAYFARRGWRAPWYRSQVFPGTDHSETAWSARVGDVIAFLMGARA